jgi:hypothetical protein
VADTVSGPVAAGIVHTASVQPGSDQPTAAPAGAVAVRTTSPANSALHADPHEIPAGAETIEPGSPAGVTVSRHAPRPETSAVCASPPAVTTTRPA